ncbi:MAG: hypothetical protein KC736_02225 [Candidatus Moranbacteria bacterium]|nr:hypothetical protein [Candidatus Moranbacteria bacterium]
MIEIIIGLTILGISGMITILTGPLGTGLILIGLTGLLTTLGYREVKTSPPERGMVTILKKKTHRTLGEGIKIVAPYLFIDVIMIKVEKDNIDFNFTDVRCKANNETSAPPTQQTISGASINVDIDLTFIPNSEKLPEFTDAGQKEGVKKILEGVLEEDLRQNGPEKTWEEWTAGKDLLTFMLLTKVINGTASTTFDKKESNKLKKQMIKGGVPDGHGLGILITNFNVGKVAPQGEIGKAAEQLAKEALERRSEVFESQTDVEIATILHNALEEKGIEKTFDQVLLEVRQRRSMREGKGSTFEIKGLESISDALKSLLGGR